MKLSMPKLKFFQKEDEPKVELNSIILYVNSICNATCKMCDIGQKNKKGIDILRMSNTNVHLDINLLKRLLEDPYMKERSIGFNLLMTEPLLTPNVHEMVKLIKDYGHHAHLITNGFLLPQKAKNLIDAGLDSIQVSLDGPRDVHNEIRGGDFYERAIEGLKIINQHSNIMVIVNCTISNLNYPYLLDFLNEINKEVKVDLLKFQFLDFVSEEMKARQNDHYPVKCTTSSISEFVDPRKVDVKKLGEQLRAIKPANYTNIKEIAIVPFITSENGLEDYFNVEGWRIEDNDKCNLPWRSFTFRTDGKIIVNMRCFNYVYGDFNKNSIEEIWVEGEKINWFRNELKKVKQCFPFCTRCCGVMKFYYGPS